MSAVSSRAARRGLTLRCVSTSIATEVAARALGLAVEPFEQLDQLDIAIDGQEVSLTAEEVEVRLQAKPGWAAANDQGVVVVLATAALAGSGSPEPAVANPEASSGASSEPPAMRYPGAPSTCSPHA